MDKNLIFDLGFYNGDSSLFYLNKGFNVIGVDCNPNIEIEDKRINEFLDKKQLILEKKCITDKDNDIVDFYVQPNLMVWSSTNIKIAERLDKSQCIKVETTTLASLIKKYGTPIFCKIDIEGNDGLALKSLFDVEEKPLYISCETECIGNEDPFTIDGLENINIMKELGYNKFLLIEQNIYLDFNFDINCEYNWKTYEEICEELKNARQKHVFYKPYSFWWDVYATF